jgi:hypothetical protein
MNIQDMIGEEINLNSLLKFKSMDYVPKAQNSKVESFM